MMTLYFMITVLILTASSKAVYFTAGLKTTCEIPSVESGEEATLTTYFSEDLSNTTTVVFIVLHQIHGSEESEILSCRFNNGRAECDKTSCCTWEREVTVFFRVYIHNVSKEHEGKFWGVVLPAEGKDQAFCNFSLKASTCSTVFINATNSHMTCNDRTVAIGQTCTVTCSPNHYFLENQTSVTYTCVGKNKWSPIMSVRSCEVYTCSTDTINVANSYVLCSDQSISIGKTCTMTCNSGHYFQVNQTSLTYTCVGKNKWYPEMTVILCEEKLKDEKTNNRFLLLLLLITIPVVIVTLILVKRRYCDIRKRRQNKCGEDPLLPIQSTNQELQQLEADYWLRCIKSWYADFQSKTYFIPPFHHAENRMLMPHAFQEFEHCGRALQRVLQCLRTLADYHQQEEVMMVISQRQFGMHLGKPSFVAVALLSPHSAMLEQFCQQHYDQGDSDVLIIHKKIGLITLEVKGVGDNFCLMEMEQQQYSVLMEKVKEAVKQLNNSENVLKYLISAIPNITYIIKILALPNINSSQLLRAIRGNPSAEEDLCQCLGVQTADDALKLCLLSDQVSDTEVPPDVNCSSFQALTTWWQNVLTTSRSQSLMTSSLYEQIIARFGGPVTLIHCVTVPHLNISSLGEAVSKIGKRVYKLALLPEQVDILNQSPPRAFLSGPPGTGKTIVLILQCLTWLQSGHDVHIVSTRDKSRAAAIVIERQLQEILKTSAAKSHVHQHQFNFEKDGEVETAVKRLKKMRRQGRQLCVIADEAVRDDRMSFREFCDLLINNVPDVHIWGASVYHGVRPLCLEDFKLTIPLRSPPIVIREVMESREIKSKEVNDYTFSEVPVLNDGPPIKRIKHREGQSDHREKWPRGCVKCGHEVARVLAELNVGRRDGINGRPYLQYRDVLVLCVAHSDDDRVGRNVQTTTKASGLVQGMRERKVPLRVVGKDDVAAIRDMALGVSDLVAVASWDDTHGLERKVVVVESGNDWFYERLYAMSRCTSQLVLIHYEPAR